MKDPALCELVGSMLMIGFEDETLTPEVRELLLEVRPGGIILFRRNVGGGPERTARLLEECQDLARSEFGRFLLTAVDQEGGPVIRLAPPFTQLPSQREMAEKLTPEEVGALGKVSGGELAAAGFNLNLAPVLDLNTDPEASYMRERTFGSDPGVASDLGLRLIAGHRSAGVLTCAKHFPGIGDTRLDPHQDLPTVTHSAERIRSVELEPFARAAAGGAAGVMTAHVNFPGLDPDWPGTFSEIILDGLLRREMGFDGLILTDDLEMGAVIKHYRIGPAAVRTVRAGSDLLLVCRRSELIREAFEALYRAASSGELRPERLEESSRRLEQARKAIESFPPPPRPETGPFAAG